MLTIVIGATGAIPTTAMTAMTATANHSAPTEVGATVRHDHMNYRTGLPLTPELDNASRDPAWTSAIRGEHWPVAKDAQGKARDEGYREKIYSMRTCALPSGEK